MEAPTKQKLVFARLSRIFIKHGQMLGGLTSSLLLKTGLEGLMTELLRCDGDVELAQTR
jgi:hypothetical protein